MLEINLSGPLNLTQLSQPLFSAIDQAFYWGKGDDSAPNFHEWVTSTIIDGHPFTYKRHEYLVDPYKDDHSWLVEQKAAQLGLTSKAMLRAAYGARYENMRGILYLFPSKTDVTEFSKGRITPLIEDNPDHIGQWIKDTDAANIKRIANCFLYLRGMQSRVGLKSVPADFIVFDELDEAPQANITMALQRMAHSEFKRVHMLSNPTLPDFGINKEFKLTDMRYWLLKCPICGGYTCMEDTFPNCIHTRPNGEVIRLCQICKNGELSPGNGKWIAKRPAVTEKRGYHYSQLFSSFVTPTEVLSQFLTTTNLADFYNLVIGREYVSAENRLSVEQVLSLCEQYPNLESSDCESFMGVDVGNILYVTISRINSPTKPPSKLAEVVHLGRYKDWADIHQLMKKFRISRCVVDALPETRNARELAMAFPGRVFLCYYSDHQKGEFAWNDDAYTVTVNRTESLDASHKELLKQLITLPSDQLETTQLFAKHCHAIAKKLEKNEDTGMEKYVYVSLDPEDHFRHSFNYDMIARTTGPRWLFPEAQ